MSQARVKGLAWFKGGLDGGEWRGVFTQPRQEEAARCSMVTSKTA